MEHALIDECKGVESGNCTEDIEIGRDDEEFACMVCWVFRESFLHQVNPRVMIYGDHKSKGCKRNFSYGSR